MKVYDVLITVGETRMDTSDFDKQAQAELTSCQSADHLSYHADYNLINVKTTILLFT